MIHPPEDHKRFDEICADLDEFDTLPQVDSDRAREAREQNPDDDALRVPIDEQILAGLICPQ